MIDPILLDLAWTLSACGVLLFGAALSLWNLPWSDADLESAEQAARALFTPSPRPVHLRR